MLSDSTCIVTGALEVFLNSMHCIYLRFT